MRTMDYQVYVFRLIHQERHEPFDSFVNRLKNQAEKCQFSDRTSQLRDQIIEKCNMAELRSQVFQHNMTLDQLILTARTLEQAENNIAPSRTIFCDVERRNIYRHKRDVECTACCSNEHEFYDVQCPARKSVCEYCKSSGHFTAFCRSFKRKRIAEATQSSSNGTKRVSFNLEPFYFPIADREPCVENFAEIKPSPIKPQSPENVIRRADSAISQPSLLTPKLEPDETHECHIGNVKLRAAIGDGQNVMTSGLLKDMTPQKYVLKESDLEIEGEKYTGTVSTYIRNQIETTRATFYLVENDRQKKATINRAIAKRLKLVH